MAPARTAPGRLIAVDGTRGRDVGQAADMLAEHLRERGLTCGISRWDASGLFNELALAGRDEGGVSPRTLTLAYVADLAFRLRWEIQPVINQGGVVIAAPYIQTVIAFGAACGLPARWLTKVLALAPQPAVRCLAVERKPRKGWQRRVDRGYAEYGAAVIGTDEHPFETVEARTAMIAALGSSRTGRVWTLSKSGLHDVVDAITAVPRVEPSRPSGLRTRSAGGGGRTNTR